MKRTSSKLGVLTGVVSAILLAGGLLTACGGVDLDGAVLARNLQTGEEQSFASPGDVPPDFFICPDSTCTLPPSVPCAKLGDKACELQPECRLHVLWCEGSGVTPTPVPAQTPGSSGSGSAGAEPGNPGGGVAKDPNCHYECIPATPLLCEELKDEQACKGRSDCDWAAVDCMMGCQEGQPCPPCGGGVCQKKAPPQCGDVHDEAQCGARSDCEWQAAPCLPGETCTAGACVPKQTICPAIAPKPPICEGGVLEPRYDSQGCLVGYVCVKPPMTCGDLDQAYRKVLKKARECNPFTTSMAPQCTQQVIDALYCGNCSVFINGAATAELKKLNDLRATFKKMGCSAGAICPAIACHPPTSASCEYDSASQQGFCVGHTSAP